MTRVMATATKLHMAIIIDWNLFGQIFGKTIFGLIEEYYFYVIIDSLEIMMYPYLLKGPLP